MIREYEEQDLNQLLDVWYLASLVAHSFLNEDFFEQERKDIAALYLPNAETWVYEMDGAVVGFISLLENEVGAIFVDPKFHRRGIGCALMDKARSLRGSLVLDVFKDNLVGRKFYEKYGFRQVGEELYEETGFVMLRLALQQNPTLKIHPTNLLRREAQPNILIRLNIKSGMGRHLNRIIADLHRQQILRAQRLHHNDLSHHCIIRWC